MEAVRRSRIDDDRRRGTKSLSIETYGDIVFFHGTTGVVAVGDYFDLYLTANGGAAGERLFDKTPEVVVYKDDSASAGGFPRGQGPMAPTDSYAVSPHTGAAVKWDTGSKKWYVRVTNSTSSARDFVVVASGL